MTDEKKWIYAREAAKVLDYKDTASVSRLAAKNNVRTRKGKRSWTLYHKGDLEKAREKSELQCVPYKNLYTPPEYNTFPRLKGDWMVIADCHCPLVDWALWEESLRVRDKLKLKNLVLAGDTLNCTAFSRFYEIVRIPWEVEKESAAELICAACKEYDKVVMLTANHELRYLRRLWIDYSERVLKEGQMLDVWQQVTANVEKEYKSRLRITIFPYCVINEKPGPGWRIIHPSAYRKIPLSLGREMAALHYQNIITTHAHMSAWSYAPNTELQLIDCGVFANPKTFSYKNLRVTAHFLWSESFVAIKDNAGYLFRKGDKWAAVL